MYISLKTNKRQTNKTNKKKTKTKKLTTLGLALRYIGCFQSVESNGIPIAYCWMMAGQMLMGIAYPFYANSPTRIAGTHKKNK